MNLVTCSSNIYLKVYVQYCEVYLIKTFILKGFLENIVLRNITFENCRKQPALFWL